MRKSVLIILIIALVLGLARCEYRVDYQADDAGEKVCRINLFASNGSYDKKFLLLNLGHAFISVENITDEEIMVGEYALAENEEITLSLWPVTGHMGVWYNIESNMINTTDKYSDRVSVSFDIGRGTLEKINSFLSEASAWSIFYNCSSFTLDIYNIITGSDYSPPVVTPATLIKIFEGHECEVGRQIALNDNVGYYVKGEFTKCALKY